MNRVAVHAVRYTKLGSGGQFFAHVRLGVSFMELLCVRWCSAGHQECADPRGDLGLGADLGEVEKSLILGQFYDFILVLLANGHFSSCTGCVQILVLFSV